MRAPKVKPDPKRVNYEAAAADVARHMAVRLAGGRVDHGGEALADFVGFVDVALRSMTGDDLGKEYMMATWAAWLGYQRRYLPTELSWFDYNFEWGHHVADIRDAMLVGGL